MEIRNEALKEAAAMLAIQMPVTIRRTTCSDDFGHYCGVRNGRHLITLGPQSSEDANETLWHELAHASQREQFGTEDEWHLAFNAAGWLPETNRFEIEAERIAMAQAPSLALVA